MWHWVDRFLSLWSFVIYLVAIIVEYYARDVNVDTWYVPADYFARLSHLVSLRKNLLFDWNYSHRKRKILLVQLQQKYKSFFVVFLSRMSWYWSITAIGAYQPSRSNREICWAWRSWNEIRVPSKQDKSSVLELIHDHIVFFITSAIIFFRHRLRFARDRHWDNRMLKYFDGDQSNACNNNYKFGQVIFNRIEGWFFSQTFFEFCF